jgi:hypothetical protein
MGLEHDLDRHQTRLLERSLAKPSAIRPAWASDPPLNKPECWDLCASSRATFALSRSGGFDVASFGATFAGGSIA